MSNTTITINGLSKRGIDDAIKQIRRYQRQFNAKVSLFIERLGKVGLNVVESVMAEIPKEDSQLYDTELILDKQGGVAGCTIVLCGNQVLFIEFSAGITYGQENYPLDGFEKYGMGTFNPKSPNWKDPNGWWYTDLDGNVKHTYGTRAYMPMYKAEMAIIMQVREIAREVFG